MGRETTASNPSMATAGFHLSLQQEWTWSQHERGVPQSAQCVLRITGTLDRGRLEQALGSVVARNEILRTRFRRQTGIKLPFQVILDDNSFQFQSLEAGESHFSRVADEQRATTVNLEQDPPLRAVLVRSGAQLHYLVLTLPALSADAASLRNLSSELSTAYGNSGGDSDVMQYADLVEWQNQLLASEETKAGRDFWRTVCRNLDFSTLQSAALPLERKVDAPFRPACLRLPASGFDAAISSATTALKASDHDLLLAAWAALLVKLTGQPSLTL